MRVVVVGFGYWGPNLARTVALVDGIDLIGIVEKDEVACGRAKAAYPTTKVYTTLEEALSNGGVDAVLIATPARTHHSLASIALSADCHVLVEKPLATSVVDAEDLVQIAERRNLILMTDHTYLFSSAVNGLKKFIDAGELGPLVYLDSTRCNLGIFQPDVSVLWDLAVHDVAILRYIIDEQPTHVSAVAGRHPQSSHDAAVFLTIKFASGFFAHINVSWLSPMKIRQMVVSGEFKTVLFNDMNVDERLRVYDAAVKRNMSDQRELIEYRLGDIAVPRIVWVEPLRTEIEHFRDAIAGRVRPLSDGRFSLGVVKILEAASTSLSNNSKLIEVNL